MKRNRKTEENIINVALELFVHNGYHGTSINEIVQKVGVTKGSLYAHFSSKGDLLLRIIHEFKINFIDAMISSANECQGNSLQKLNHIINFNSRFALEKNNLCIFLTFLTTELNTTVDFESPLKNVYKDYQKYISQLMRHGIQQGLFKKDLDPELASLTFMALHDGVLHQWMLNRDNIDGEQYVRTFKKIFLHGLVDTKPV